MSDRLSICLITTFYPPHGFGGDAVHARRLAEALARRGHRVDLVYSRDAYEALGGDDAAEGEARWPAAERSAGRHPPSGLEVHRLSCPGGRIGSLAAAFLTHQLGEPVAGRARLRRLLEGRSPDVIHYHNVSLIGGPGILSWGSGVKLFTPHEYWLVCPTHMLFRYGREICRRRTCVRCTLSYGRPPQPWRWTGKMERQLRHVDRILAPSELTASVHRQHGVERPIQVLPHFLPDAYRRRAESLGIRDPEGVEPFCLYVGRLDRVKGLQTVVPAFAAGTPGMPLEVVGEGPQEAELRELAGGSSEVRFRGRVAGAELGRLYRDAVALLLPSAAYEVFGLVILEAFAHATPALVSPVGGGRELVWASGAGTVYRDIDDLCFTLRRLRDEPELRSRWGAAGRRYLDERHGEDDYVERYERIVDELRRAVESPSATASGGPQAGPAAAHRER